MFLIEKTDHFDKWFKKLKDIKAKAKIAVLLKKLEAGNLSDHKSVGGGLSEFRLDFGRGYRIYYRQHKRVVIILLIGGDKSTQSADIVKAKSIWKEIKAHYENES